MAIFVPIPTAALLFLGLNLPIPDKDQEGYHLPPGEDALSALQKKSGSLMPPTEEKI